jgi:hypothetical protein
MRKRKRGMERLLADAAFVGVITVLNRCLETRNTPMIKRGDDEKSLSRKLTLVSLVYHAIGILYNE